MTTPSWRGLSGRELELRAERLERLMTPCRLCPRECGIDRATRKGYCRSGLRAGVASHNLHRGEEPPISGTRGSGTVFFHHCTLSCSFCQNYPVSQLHDFPEVDDAGLASMFLELQSRGAHNINLVTPSHFAPQIVRALTVAAGKGLSLPLVYNSSGYERRETVELLDGLVDIWLPDMKYADESLAQELSDAKQYVTHNREAVQEMFRQTGPLTTDADGIAVRGLVIRHLVLPGRTGNTKRILEYIAEKISPSTVVSLMSQYFPAWKAGTKKDMDRGLTHAEYDEIVEYALTLGMENCLVQDLDATGNA